MRVFLLMVLILLSKTEIVAEFSAAHRQGLESATSQQSQVMEMSKSIDPSIVLGYSTDRPAEASLDNGSIASAAITRAKDNEASHHIVKHSRERKTFKIDPAKDPMLINANRAVNTPQETMKQVIMEDAGADVPQSKEFICEEGGSEYSQTCTKQRVVILKITPEIKETRTRCPGHEKKKRVRLHFKHWTEYCGGCESYEVITQHKRVDVASEYWKDGCVGLEEQADKGVCKYVSLTKDSSKTQTIQGEPVTRDHWVETYQYSCLKPSKNNCSELCAKGCTQVSSTCIEQIGGVCVLWRQTYKCESKKIKSKSYRAIGNKTPYCLTGNCVDSSYEGNTQMLEALSQLAVLKEAQNDIRANVCIFKGQKRECRKNCVGFRDCCTTGKGWGVSLRLAECSGEERELADWRAKNKCVVVGTYCAEKALGKCTRKKTSFCCFGTKLSKIIQEQGRQQLGIGWGDPKSANCRGLTPEELSRMDMSKLDLSELYSDIQANFKTPTNDQLTKGVELKRIQQNMTKLSAPTSDQKR